MFKTRLLSGIVLVIVAVAAIAAGGPLLFAVLLCISLIGMEELYRAMDVHQKEYGLLETAGSRDFYDDSSVYPGADHGSLCIYLSKVQGRAGDGSHVRCALCGSDALLHL